MVRPPFAFRNRSAVYGAEYGLSATLTIAAPGSRVLYSARTSGHCDVGFPRRARRVS